MLENAGEWMGIVALVMLVGDRISKLTATKKDDAIFAIIYRVATVLGLRILPTNAGPGAMNGKNTVG